MTKKRLFLLCGFLVLCTVLPYADEPEPDNNTVDSAEEEKPAEEDQGGTRLSSGERQRIELELKTSTLPELAAWCRTLGLSEGGTRADLTRRIRDHYKIPEPREKSDDSRKIITIESAQKTEYFRIEVVDEDYARLNGEVYMILKDKDSVHKIKANDILFNRTRNILTARGEVEYIKEQGDTIEIFRGKNITVNIDNWSSVFLDGASEKRLEDNNSAYLFSGAVITRSDEDVMILNKARISNAWNEEALWSIDASKVWLLPGSDFAIFNALLKVGEIPVMYIPFFYFPADEVVFHPVIGFRSREGGYVQTTTYIMGRPKANSEENSSLTRILGSSNDMEKKQHGLFLRSTGKKAIDPNAISLKALIDYYTNLGFYFGLDFTTPKLGVLNALDLSLGIGLTRTITEIGGNYDPFAPNYTGEFDWNRSNLFSQDVPFRYRLRTQSSAGGKYGSMSWNFPFYSDPYVDKDFLTRSENMDWVNMIQQGAAIEEDIISDTNIQSYQWQLNGNLRPSWPILAPYISSISLSNISMTLSFKTIEDAAITNMDSPGRYFFAPDRATLYGVSGSMSGTPLSLDGSKTAAAAPKPPAIDDPLKDIGIPRSPWAERADTTDKKTTNDNLIPPVLNQRFDLPKVESLKFSIDYQLSPTSSSELQFMSGTDHWKTYNDVDWTEVQSILGSFGGNGSINVRIDQTNNLFTNAFTLSGGGTYREYWHNNEDAEVYTPTYFTGEWGGVFRNIEFAEDLTWKSIANDGTGLRGTYVSSGNTVTMTIAELYDGTAWSNDLSQLTGSTILRAAKSGNTLTFEQGNNFIGEKDKFRLTSLSDRIIKAREEQYKQSYFSTSYNNTFTLRPLYKNSVFGQSNLQYSFRGTLGKTKFIGTGDAPEWEWQTGTGEKEENDVLGFTGHQFSTNILATIMDKQQNLTLSAELPPIDPAISASAIFRVWISETNARVRVRDPGNPEDRLERIEPFYLTVTLRFSNIGNVSYYMVVDPKEDDNRITTITSSLTLWNLKASFSAVRMKKYEFEASDTGMGGSWIQGEDPYLYPRDLSIQYNRSFSNIDIIKDRLKLSLNLNSSLFFDLQRYTNSNFQFSLGFTLGVAGFLDLTFSARSENAVIFRYFKNVPGMEDLTSMYLEGDQNNIFTDLIDSFNFGDEAKRQRSGFKMKGLSLSANHHVGDWNAILDVTMSTYLDNNSSPPKYNMNADVSFLIQWVPITEIKSDIKYEKRKEDNGMNPWTIK